MPKHHFENCGKESIYPNDEDSVTFSLGLYMEETHVWFYVYKSNVGKYFTHKNKSRLVYRPTYEAWKRPWPVFQGLMETRPKILKMFCKKDSQ